MEAGYGCAYGLSLHSWDDGFENNDQNYSSNGVHSQVSAITSTQHLGVLLVIHLQLDANFLH